MARKGKERRRGMPLEDVISTIRKQMGDEAIMRLGSDYKRRVEVIPTGALSLDIALGIGGVPRGRVVEIYGPEAGGKTTLALHIIANAQRMGGVAAFIDAEHALDVNYAKRLGVDVENLLLSQPDYGEQALEIADMLISSGEVDVVVLDSVAALVPKAELEGQMGDQFIGLQARLMSQALRKLTATIGKSKAVMIFINQIRMKVGVMFGNPEVTSGGRALKFYSSIRIEVRRLSLVKDGDVARGNRVLAKVVKNKLAAPFKEAEFEIVYNQGIDYIGDLLDCGVKFGLIERSGVWYSFAGERLGQGRDRAIAFLKENADVLSRLEAAVMEHAGIERGSVDEEDKGKV